MPNQQKKVKLSELGGISYNEVGVSPSQNNRPHGHGRNLGEGSKKMKEGMCSRVGGQVVAVEKRGPKEISVPGVGRKVNPVGDFSGKGPDSHARLTSGGKNTGKMFTMSKSRKEMWERMKKRAVSAGPPLVPAHVEKMRDYRPTGKTYRKAHYDPKEVPDDKAKQILEKRQRNDSKPGGLSKSRMFGKKHQELGGNRGYRQPYRERPDRPFNFDEDENEDGPTV